MRTKDKFYVVSIAPSKFSDSNGEYEASDITVGKTYEVVSTDKFTYKRGRFETLKDSIAEEYLLVDDSDRTSWHSAAYFLTESEYKERNRDLKLNELI